MLKKLAEVSKRKLILSVLLMQQLKQVKILLSLTKGTEVDNQIIHVDLLILFMRLILLVERSENTVNYFVYELTPYTTYLLQENFMQHPDKSDLMHALLNYKSEITGKKRKKVKVRIVNAIRRLVKEDKQNEVKTSRKILQQIEMETRIEMKPLIMKMARK